MTMDLLPKTPETSVSVHATTSAWSRSLRSVPTLTFEKVHLLLEEIGGTGKTKEKGYKLLLKVMCMISKVSSSSHDSLVFK